jgi:hypothetical protein
MKSYILLLFALVFAFSPTPSRSASTACEGYSAEKLGKVFETGIRLNQRLKELVRQIDSDDAVYAAARKKNSEFAEMQAIPCLDRAAKLLLRSKQHTLFGKVLALADSYENMADESVSETLALLYVARADDFEALLKLRSKPSQASLLKRTKEGIERQDSEIGKAITTDRAKRLERLLGTY